MSPNKYQYLAMSYLPDMESHKDVMNYTALGLGGEAGEYVDIIKKYYYHGHPLDKFHAVRELGDVLWYVATAAHELGYSLEKVMKMNIDKLKNRYPNGFDVERSLHRAEGDV